MKHNGVTSALVVSTSDGIRIPSKYLDMMNCTYALMMLVKNKIDTKIVLLPLYDNDIYLLRVEMDTISAAFLKNLSVLLNSSGIVNPIFTTGICEYKNKCFYECYFYKSTLNISIDALYKLISELKDADEVSLERVTD